MAEFFQVKEKTIWDWKNKGMPYVKIGQTVRYNLDEVIEWAKENE